MSDRYPIVLFWSEDDEARVAHVSDLRSCSARGATPWDAVREVKIVRRLWLESAGAQGTPLPDRRESNCLPDSVWDALKAKAPA